jgi:hypothetical protein
MAAAKIEIRVGGFSFAGEGNERWLSSQLEKVLWQVPKHVWSAHGDHAKGGVQSEVRKSHGPLAAFLTAKKATHNKTRAFLAAAVWLQDRGVERLTTSEVNRILSESKRVKLANASQRLAHNVRRGLCAKVGRTEFYVTEEGRAVVG